MAVLRADDLRGHECETADPITKKLKGCEEPVDDELAWSFGKYVFNRCVWHYLTDFDFVNQAFTINSWISKGIPPFPGGLRDQPAKILRVVEIIDTATAERLKEGKR